MTKTYLGDSVRTPVIDQQKLCYFCASKTGVHGVMLGWLTFAIAMCRRCRAEIGQ